MAEVKTVLRTNTDYNANVTVDGAVAVTLHGAVTTANPGNYNMNRVVNDQSLYEANKSTIDEESDSFEAMVKAAANTENDEGVVVLSTKHEQSKAGDSLTNEAN